MTKWASILLALVVCWSPLPASSEEKTEWKFLPPSDLALILDYGDEFDVLIRLSCNETGDINISELNTKFDKKKLIRNIQLEEPLLVILETNVDGIWTEFTKANLALVFSDYYGAYGFRSDGWTGIQLKRFNHVTGLRLRSVFLMYEAPNNNLALNFNKWIEICASR